MLSFSSVIVITSNDKPRNLSPIIVYYVFHSHVHSPNIRLYKTLKRILKLVNELYWVPTLVYFNVTKRSQYIDGRYRILILIIIIMLLVNKTKCCSFFLRKICLFYWIVPINPTIYRYCYLLQIFHKIPSFFSRESKIKLTTV